MAPGLTTPVHETMRRRRQCPTDGGVHAPAFVEPATVWVPTATVTSGPPFYAGGRLPRWCGQAFVGALAGTTLWRPVLDGDRVAERTRAVLGAPDGAIVMLTGGGCLPRPTR